MPLKIWCENIMNITFYFFLINNKIILAPYIVNPDKLSLVLGRLLV